MIEVDSQALQKVSKVLQLSRGGSQLTEFQDELLQQVLDIAPIARRGLTLASTEGIHGANIINVHPGADTQSTTVDPWNLAGSANPPFPNAIPTFFDLWLLRGSAFTSAGAGNFTSADLTVLIPAANGAFGALGATGMRLASWADELSIQGGQLSTNAEGDGIPLRFGMRLPRNATIRFRSTSTAAATYRFDMFLGLFPSSLGQDGLV